MLQQFLGPLGGMQPRQVAVQVLSFAMVLSTAFMVWKGLSVLTDSQSPIVVVLSGSMEPAFQRGDLLFLWNRARETRIGEVVVYSVKGKDIPIVHRVVRRFGGGDSPLRLLTKGDNNVADDTELYARGQSFLNRDNDVIGSVFAYIPFVGYVTILLTGMISVPLWLLGLRRDLGGYLVQLYPTITSLTEPLVEWAVRSDWQLYFAQAALFVSSTILLAVLRAPAYMWLMLAWGWLHLWFQ